MEREKEGGKSRLSQKCSKLLSARSELFEMAGKPSRLDSIQALYSQVKESPQKNYFLIVAMSMVGAIFVFGLFCGRVTRRNAAAKDK
jgi:Golgi apparatus protein 1